MSFSAAYPPDSPIWNFLPLLSREEKASTLHLLDVFVELMKEINVDYFFTNGALLGVVRHRGIIPWDDDLDLAINVKDWQKVKDTLCCVEGFTVALKDIMHWKFFEDSSYVIRSNPQVICILTSVLTIVVLLC